MIVVADINTLWRRKPFEACGKCQPILGLAPRDIFLSLRQSQGKPQVTGGEYYRELPVTLPPGWASRFATFSSWCLWLKVVRLAKTEGSSIEALVVTSPHYFELVNRLCGQLPIFYYCSDDYRQYKGWGGDIMRREEEALVKAVNHSFFVSKVLADRAVHEYALPAEHLTISPNATDRTCLESVEVKEIECLFNEFPSLRRPLVGVIGGINERLDFEAILAVANLSDVGSIVMVGGIDATCDIQLLESLRSHSKCVFTGHRPHGEIRAWMQALDVALIPYRDNPLNRACSPMRLYDHLAAGKPIVATANCDQVNEFQEIVQLARTQDELCHHIIQACQQSIPGIRLPALLDEAACHTWEVRASMLLAKIGQHTA